MPQVKCIQSLREICLQFVVRNIDLWCKQSTSDLISIGPKISNNPFDQFPRVILEEIIIFYQRTTHRKSNGNIVLQHLMTPRLVRVLLPCDQELLELAVVRSPQLKHLELFHGIFDSFPKFHGIFDSFPKFENLEVLHLPSETEDNSLQVIGSYCTKLRELDISFCSGVTDHGIEGLCLGLNNAGVTISGRCKFLQVLTVGNGKSYKITKKGVKIALENLPALRILNHNTAVEVLADIAQTHLNQMLLPPKFTLSVLRVTFWTPYSSGNLGLAISMCSSITSMHIDEAAGFTDRDLLTLMALEKLQNLYIHADPNLGKNQEKITFDGGLLPLLKLKGGSLEELELFFLSDVDVYRIAEFCPNLEDLHLEDILSYTCSDEVNVTLTSKRSRKDFKWKSLTNLYICVLEYEKSTNHPPREILLFLLSSPFLSKIEILSCDTLTDNVLLAATKIHQFENVTEIYLQNCDFVSKRGIDVFMQGDNSLDAICFNRCKKVNQENIDFWENQAQKKNWDLYIEFIGCP